MTGFGELLPLSRQIRVRTIAEWRIFGVLAIAQRDGAFFCQGEFDGSQASALVRAVTKRLRL